MGTSRGGPCSVSTVCCVDLGLVKAWRPGGSRAESASACRHISYREGRQVMGTVRYMSLHSHLRLELSRRDDLESIAYVLVYLANGSLPWQQHQKQQQQGHAAPDVGHPALGDRDRNRNNNSRHDEEIARYENQKRIGQLKREISSAELCRRLPPQLTLFLDVVRALEFDEEPPYALLFVRLIASLLFLSLHFTSLQLNSTRTFYTLFCNYLCAQDLLLSAYSAQFGGHVAHVVPATGAAEDVEPADERQKKKQKKNKGQKRRQEIESYVAPDWRYDWVLYLRADEQFQEIQQKARELLQEQQPMNGGQTDGELPQM